MRLPSNIGAMTKEQITALRAAERVNGLSNFNAIREYYVSDLPIPLSDKQTEIKDRWEKTFSVLSKGLPTRQTVKKLTKVLKISEAQAHRDIKNVIALFGDIRKTSKDGMRVLVNDLALEAYQLAKKDKDAKGMNAAVANMIKLNGLDKETAEVFDQDKLQNAIYAVVLDPEMRDLFMQVLDSSGSVDLTGFLNNVKDKAEEISFEEVTDEEPK